MSAVELQRSDSKTRDELKPGEFKVYINDPETNARGNFPTNAIRTSKYNVITFLPLNLIEQFQRLANVYFLLVVLIQFVPNVSPFSVWTSLLPLLFILAISAIKSGIEDWRRHRADARANSRCYRAVAVAGVGRIVPEGGIIKLASRDVRVGSILRIEKGEEFPADMIVLATSNIDSSCYENTSALDGEAVPKLRVASSLTMHHTTAQQIGELRGAVTLKAPTAALHSFEGRITVKSDSPTSGVPAPLGVKQLVLRGSKLANTDWVLAMVIYTGAQTKMMLNRNPTRFKFTKFERQLNQLVIMLFIFNLLLCVVAAIVFSTSDTQWSTAFDLNDQSAAVGWIYAFLTQYILFSFTIPLSLYVTIEIVKVGQAAFMEWDSQMRWISPVDGKEHGMQCKASALNEELGMIDYVFSDKTGTLTENEMELSCLSVAGTLCYMAGSAQHKAAVAKASALGESVPLTLHELAASVLAHGFDGTGTLSAEDHTATTFAERPITAFNTAAIMSGTDINVNVSAAAAHTNQLQTVSAMIAAGVASGTGVHSLSHNHHHDPKVISVAPAGSHARALSGEHHQNQHHLTTADNHPNAPHGMRIHTAIMSQNGDVANGGLASVSDMPTMSDMPYSPVDHSEPLSGAFPVRWDGAPQTPVLPNRYAATTGLPPIRGAAGVANAHSNHTSGSHGSSSGSSSSSSSSAMGGGGGYGHANGAGPRFHAEPVSPFSHNRAIAAYSSTHDNHDNKVESLTSADPNFETWAHREFILSLLLCHSVLPVIEGEDPAKPPAIAHSPVDADKRKYIFQSQSPDEIALVDAIHRCGVTFHRRAGSELILHLRLKESDVGSGAGAALPTPRVGNGSPKRSESGVRVATAIYQVVAELEFTSARRRMSVVIRCPDGSHKLYVKGADAALFPLIDKSLPYQQKLVGICDGHVTDFAGTGSRTLVFGGRTLPRAEFDHWFAMYSDASTALNGREAKVEKAFTLLEKNLYLLGATAVEDHLQAGVPEAIDFMLKAKLKVVVLTGDKKETAVTIAKQCSLIRDTARILYVNGNSMEETKASLEAAIHVMAKMTGDTELLEMSAPTPRSRAQSSAQPGAVPGATPLIKGGTVASGENNMVPTVIPPSPLVMPQPSPKINAQPPRAITPIPLLLPASPVPLPASAQNAPPPAPVAGAAMVVGPAKEPTPHVSPQPSPTHHHASAATLSVPASVGDVKEFGTKKTKQSFALAIDGMAMEWCITQYLAQYVALFKRCDTTVSYRSTPLQKAMAVKMAKKSLGATCLAVGDGANDVSMIQESDVGVGIMGKEGSHAAMSADYVVLRFKHLLRLIFVHGRYSFYRTAKVCLFSFYKNTAFPTPTWYFQFYCLGTGQSFFDPFLMSGFNMFFSSLPPFVVGMLEKDMGEDEVMAAPEAYDIFKKNSIFTVGNFFVWMGEAIYHSLITWFIALGHFGTQDVGLHSGKTGGLWYHGDTVFAAGVILVNIQMFINCRNITWFNPGAGLLGIAGYFIMLSMISYSYWITLAPDALGQMDYIYGSAIPYFYWILALVACFIPQAVIRCYMSLWRPDVTQRLHRQMLKIKGATPSTSPTNRAQTAAAAGAAGGSSHSHHTPPVATPMSRNGNQHIGSNGIPATPASMVHRTGAATTLMPPPSSSHANIPPSPIRAH